MHKIRTEIEVRYQETDQMGVVYHGNYLTWFEIGRTKLIHSLGLNYVDMEEQNVVSPVTEANLSFAKPIRYGGVAYIDTWVSHYDGLRTTYQYEVLNEDEEVAVTGHTTHVIVNKETFRPLSLRRTFPEWHQVYNELVSEGE